MDTQFSTPKGNTVLVKEYITGRDMNEYRKIAFSSMRVSNLDPKSGTSNTEFDTSMILQQEEKALQLTVLELNGSSENVLQRIMDLPSDEYEHIVKEVNERFFLAKQ